MSRAAEEQHLWWCVSGTDNFNAVMRVLFKSHKFRKEQEKQPEKN